MEYLCCINLPQVQVLLFLGNELYHLYKGYLSRAMGTKQYLGKK